MASTLWDVFLSFCGTDTRYNFTSHLYAALHRHGVRTFMDDPAIRSGETISGALLDAIQSSKTYIVVLSKNYASSGWCLDELVEILNCYRTMQRSVIPVFYNIDTSVVRHQTESYKVAFEKHQIGFAGEMEKVNNWRLALTEVAHISGKHISGKRSEADIINEIVERIVHEINPKTLEVAKYPVGLDTRVKDLTAFLSSGTEGVVRIGIYGMGGVGKTTLAKAVYNQNYSNYEGSCFLANVREASGTANGLVSLQQQLINNVLKCKNIKVDNVDHGTKLIGARMWSTKVLVVIDDLDHHKQFESLVKPFASGSVVIITTRDEQILDTIEVEPRYRYMVKELDDAESLTLFSQHAFGNAKPKNSLMALCKDVLRHAGGLPLALEVFGSSLYKKPEVGWKSFIEKLQLTPNCSIRQRLIINLDALELDDPMLKKLFLDIACFFIGEKKKRVVEILETYYPYADHNIDILKKRCLITIYDGEKLGMHDLLKDLGRDIVRKNCPDEPEKHSRLWESQIICDVLESQKGTEAIEGIILHNYYSHGAFYEGVSFAAETFKRMSKLRFLRLNRVILTGSFEQALEDLRWFCWDRCPLKCLPFQFYPRKLVILELPHSQMKTMWEIDKVSGVFAKLKTLNMSFSLNLTTIPDFNIFPCLENLNLEGCRSLEEVHRSIGTLVRLVSLNLCGCLKIRSLHNNICKLRALEILNIAGCQSLKALPIKLGKLRSLKVLNAEGLTVSELPNSIGHLSKLVEFRLGWKIGPPHKPFEILLSSNENLETLPDTVCNFRALEVLDIGYCSGLKVLPINLGIIVSLKYLNAEGLAVLNLPDSIGCLCNLVELKLSSNKSLRTLPNTICDLRALKVLKISDCSSLEALPINLGNIVSLKELNAEGLDISKLPNSIGNLSKLVNLKLSHNENLETLPDTICNLRSLEILDVSGCGKLEILPNQLWKLTRLTELNAFGATMLKILPHIESSQIALSLNKLTLSENVLTALPSGVSQLSNLEYLCVTDCIHLLSIAELPPNLKSIWANGCKSLERLPDLSSLKQLEWLELLNCSGLTEIQGLEELTSLRILHLGGCSSTFVASTCTKRLLQIYSGFGHEIEIYIHVSDFPDWISRQSNLKSKMTLDLPQDVHNFLAMILCFKHLGYANFCRTTYSVKNTTTGFILSGGFHNFSHEAQIKIVPKTIFTVSDGDDGIELTSGDADILGIHLMYENELQCWTSTTAPMSM